MTDRTSNDNHSVQPSTEHKSPDAHGQAAMLLVESMLHGLLARNVIDVADAIEIVEVASEVKEEAAEAMGDTPLVKQESLALLASIRLSLTNDLPDTAD